MKTVQQGHSVRKAPHEGCQALKRVRGHTSLHKLGSTERFSQSEATHNLYAAHEAHPSWGVIASKVSFMCEITNSYSNQRCM